jgi:carbonic anhydrase
VKSHPWIPENISVRGFIYNVKTGKLKEIVASDEARGKSAE